MYFRKKNKEKQYTDHTVTTNHSKLAVSTAAVFKDNAAEEFWDVPYSPEGEVGVT